MFITSTVAGIDQFTDKPHHAIPVGQDRVLWKCTILWRSCHCSNLEAEKQHADSLAKDQFLLMITMYTRCISFMHACMHVSEGVPSCEGEEPGEGQKALPQQFDAELSAGLASASGGSSQPSVTLTYLLKVCPCFASPCCPVYCVMAFDVSARLCLHENLTLFEAFVCLSACDWS